MKTYRVIVSFVAGIFLLWSFTASAPGADVCLAKLLAVLTERVAALQKGIEDKISDCIKTQSAKITGSKITRPSWKDLTDPDDRLRQANLDLHAAFGKLDDVSGAKVNEAVSNAFAKTLKEPRCLEAVTELEVAASGFGKHLAHADAGRATKLQTAANDVGKQLEAKGVKYTELEMGRDLDEVMDMTITGKDDWLRNQLENDNNGGFFSELHSIRSLKKNKGITVTAIEPTYPSLPGHPVTGKPVDFATTTGPVYQNGMTTDTMKKKIPKGNTDKLKELADNIIAVESVAGAGSFKWCGSDIDPSQLTEEISKLNIELTNKGSMRMITTVDFVNLPWEE